MKKYKATTVYKDESRLFYCALATFVIVFCSYVYFVSSSVAHVVMRQEVDVKIRDVETQVGTLEADYIELQHGVSADIASLRGFVIADEKIFIDTAEDTLVLSQN